jgi:hypothetical protein
MFSISTHRRFRDQLSAYIDGELEGAAAERLEKHLAGCEGCRLELVQLRATVAALHDLPEVQAPRSFALSAERAAGRRPQTRAAAPLALGVRLAAAGVAVALAAVFVVDLGGLAGDNEAGTTAPQAASDRNAEYAAPDDGAAAPNAEGAPTPATTDEANPPEGATDGASQNVSVPPAEGGDGIDALTAAEIGLAAALALLVLGGGVLAYAGRKR